MIENFKVDENIIFSTDKKDLDLRFINRHGMWWFTFGELIFATIEVYGEHRFPQNQVWRLKQVYDRNEIDRLEKKK